MEQLPTPRPEREPIIADTSWYLPPNVQAIVDANSSKDKPEFIWARELIPPTGEADDIIGIHMLITEVEPEPRTLDIRVRREDQPGFVVNILHGSRHNFESVNKAPFFLGVRYSPAGEIMMTETLLSPNYEGWPIGARIDFHFDQQKFTRAELVEGLGFHLMSSIDYSSQTDLQGNPIFTIPSYDSITQGLILGDMVQIKTTTKEHGKIPAFVYTVTAPLVVPMRRIDFLNEYPHPHDLFPKEKFNLILE